VLVEYGPGGYSPGHTHAKSAFIYATVLEGAIRSQINDGPVTTYEAGQSWSELPGDRHRVSANASETKPAKLLAVFVVDRVARSESQRAGRRAGQTGGRGEGQFALLKALSALGVA
jgi:quercetin dioxygenase-like cupin family protein